MTKAFEYKSKFESGAEVMKLAAEVYAKDEPKLFVCDICEQEFPDKELSDIEMTNGEDKTVCKKCELNLPEPDDDIDEDQFRGDR